MKEFILEEEINNVKIPQTKEYLKEVISTYHHEDYRSCIVTLYVITIYDLLTRITILAEVYNVKEAKDFTEKYNKSTLPGQNAKYSDLEHEIIDEAQKLAIIDDIEKRQIEELRSLRHDCAHPAITINSINHTSLRQPNKDDARSRIRLMFESLFLKDPNAMKQVLDGFENDVISYYNAFYENGLENYLVRTYYSKMSLDQKKKILYSPLWYNLFLNNDPKKKPLLGAYRLAMRYLIDTDKDALLLFMCNNPNQFSGNCLKTNLLEEAKRSVIGEGMSNRCFVLLEFLFRYPSFFNGLTPDIKQIVKNIAYSNFNLLWRAYYLFVNLDKHAEALLDYMNKNDVRNKLQYQEVVEQMYSIAAERGAESLYNRVATVYFTEKQQNNFSSLNNAFGIVLTIALDNMNESEILDLLDKCDDASSIPEAYCFKDQMIPKIRKIAEENNYSRILQHNHLK